MHARTLLMDATSKMATSVRVTMANLQHGKHGAGGKGSKESRSRRVHILLGLVALAVVAGVGTLIAKRGFPDIDPVKVSTFTARVAVARAWLDRPHRRGRHR